MKKTLPLIIAGILVLGGIGATLYFFASELFFLPWSQQPDYTYIEESTVIQSDDVYEDFVIDPSVEGSLEEQVVAREITEDIQESEESNVQREPETIVANFFSDLEKPRMMVMSPYGDVIVSDIKTQAVYALIDADGDYRAEKRITIIDKLNNPHGLAFHAHDLYIAETDKVRVLRNVRQGYGFDKNEIIISNLTDASGHFTRTIRIHDDMLYLTAGSSCNACVEKNENRAAWIRFTLDGKEKTILAQGLRNTVGFVRSPYTGEWYGVDNGRDWLGDILPPEEVNILREGAHYGWPFCYGEGIRDTSVAGTFDCTTTVNPVWQMGAHTAPLGLALYTGEMFPEYKGDLLIAQHGSWNSTKPVGYKVVRIDMNDQGQPQSEYTFLDIFLSGQTVKGRPVDVLVGTKGEIYITDDFAGRVYVMYKQ